LYIPIYAKHLTTIVRVNQVTYWSGSEFWRTNGSWHTYLICWLPFLPTDQSRQLSNTEENFTEFTDASMPSQTILA